MSNIFMMPTKIFTGDNALTQAKNALESLGKKAFIVAGPTMDKLGNLGKVKDVLDDLKIEHYVYAEINSEPNDRMIEKGVKLYKEQGCDFLIGLGGGSPIDAMKAIAMMAASNGDIDEQMGKTMEYGRDPMVAIPTTAGTGSEATQFTIIANTKKDIKMLLKGSKVIPDITIVDPQFTMTAPKSVTAATGVDALCHAIEAFTSQKSQPLSDTFALSAVKRIFKNLVTCYNMPNDKKARTEMSLASLEAGIAFNNASVTIVHGMSRPIGALFHIPHGLSNAMLLEVCMKFVCDGAYDRFAELSRACGFSQSQEDKEASEKFIEEISALLKNLEIPTMKEAGIDEKAYKDYVAKMSQDAMDSGSPSNTIKEVTIKDIERLYNEVYK